MSTIDPCHMDGHAQQMDAQPQINNELFFGEWAMHECMHDLNFKCRSFKITHGDLPS